MPYGLVTRVAGLRCDNTTGRQDVVSFLFTPSHEQMEIVCPSGNWLNTSVPFLNKGTL